MKSGQTEVSSAHSSKAMKLLIIHWISASMMTVSEMLTETHAPELTTIIPNSVEATILKNSFHLRPAAAAVAEKSKSTSQSTIYFHRSFLDTVITQELLGSEP